MDPKTCRHAEVPGQGTSGYGLELHVLAVPSPKRLHPSPMIGNSYADDADHHPIDRGRESDMERLLPPNHMRASVQTQSSTASAASQSTGAKSKTELQNSSGERPKILYSRRKSNTFWLFVIFHLPALAVTLTVFGLYLGKASWPLPGPSNNVLNLIQLAAKFHEGLIIGSVTQIVFHRVRYQILGQHGLPFGLLAAPFQISMIPYFFTKEFWGPVSMKHSLQHSLTVILLITAFILALTAGSSSAILMLPRLGWSSISSSVAAPRNDQGQMVTQDLYIGSNYNSLFLNRISGENTMLDICTQWFGGSYPPEYAFSGGQDLVAALTAIFFNDQAWDVAERSVNLTVSALSGSRIISVGELPYQPHAVPNNSITYATSPPDFLISALHWKSSQILDAKQSLLYRVEPKTRWKQPRVLVQCAANATGVTRYNQSPGSPDTETILFSFADGIYPAFNITLNMNFLRESFPAKLEPSYPMSGTTPATFVNLDSELQFPVSTATIFADYSDTWDTPNFLGFRSIDLCISEATWIDSHVQLVRNSSGNPVQRSENMVDIGAIVNDTSRKHQTIRLGSDWINYLNRRFPVIGDLTGAQNADFFDYLSSFCFRSTMKRTCRSLFLSSFLTDALARFQPVYPNVYFSTAINGSSMAYNVIHSESYNSRRTNLQPLDEHRLADTSLYFPIRLSLTEQTYGYRVNSVTIILALTVLLVHLLLVMVHMLVVSIIGSSWSSSAWSDLGELLALAIQSDRTELLQNTGAGASEISTWRLTTVVREVEGEGKLQLVLYNKEHDAAVSSDRNRGDLMLPRPDCEYT